MFNTKKAISGEEEALFLDGRLPQAFRHGGHHQSRPEPRMALIFARARSAYPFGASCVSPTSSSHSEVSIATRQISRYWQSRNEKKRSGVPGGAIDGKTSP